jgi:putative Holliday junction resolvase
MPETMQTLMAFDFGTQKMGIAVGQSAIQNVNPPSFPHERWYSQLG